MENPKIIIDVEGRLTNLEGIKKEIGNVFQQSKTTKKQRQQYKGVEGDIGLLSSKASKMDPELFMKEYNDILNSMKTLARNLAKDSGWVKELEELDKKITVYNEQANRLLLKLESKTSTSGLLLKKSAEQKDLLKLTGEDYALSTTKRRELLKDQAPVISKGKEIGVTSIRGLKDLANKEEDPKIKEELEKRIEIIVKAQKAAQEEINNILIARRELLVEIENAENKRNLIEDNADVDESRVGASTALSMIADIEIEESDAARVKEEELLKEKQALKAKTEAEKLAKEASKEHNKENEKTPNIVGKAIRSFISYQVIIRQLRKLINTAITTITELDKAFTEQAIVSSLSREETWKLISAYQELATQTGFTTTEIAAVATQYFRQGKTTADVLKLTEAAAKSAKVAGIDAKQAVDYLTTAINGFGLAAEDALNVSDKFAALAASSATSYEELATALSKVASQANLAGMSMDFTLGLLAKGIETTREAPESIGTALKTIIARMREITDYGATLEDGMNLNNVEKQLKYVNIELRDEQNQLRSTQDVVNELGLKWDSLTGSQQAAIAKALAGTRQQARLIAMLNDYERTLELVAISQESIGATNAQQATYLEGMGAAVNRLKTAYQAFITSIANVEFIINIVDKMTLLINGITELLQGGKGITLLVVGILTSIVALMPKITSFIQNLMLNYYGISKKAQQRLLTEKLITLELQRQAALKKVSGGNFVNSGPFAGLKTDAEIDAAFAKRSKDLSASAQVGGLTQSKGQAAMAKASWAIAGVAIAAAATVMLVQVFQEIADTSKKIAKASMEKISKAQTEIYDNVKQINTIKELTSNFDLLNDKIIKTSKDFEEIENIRKALLETYKEEDRKTKEKMTTDMLVQEQAARISNLQQDNQEKLQEIGKEYDSNKYTFGQGAATFGKATGLGAAIGTGIGVALAPFTGGLSVVLGLAFGTAIGEIAGGIATAIEKKKYEDQRAKVKEMLAEDNGLQQAQYYYAASFGEKQESFSKTNERAEEVSSLYAALISNFDQDEMLDVITKSGLTAEEYATKFAKAMATIEGSLADLTDPDVPYAKRINAVHDAINELNKRGMPELANEMEYLYGDLLAIEKTFPTTLNYLDKFGWSSQQINDFAKAVEKVGGDANYIMELLGGALTSNTEEAWNKLDDAMVNFTGDAIDAVATLIEAGRSLRSVAEEQTREASVIKGLRETQAKWGEMTAAEKASFIGENTSLFMTNGQADPEKLKTFIEGGDITDLIASSELEYQEGLRQDYNDLLRANQLKIKAAQTRINSGDLTDQEIADEKAKIEALEIEAMGIELLLDEVSTMFDLSLAEIIEKQEKQLNTYKELLEEEKDATIESLEKRKKAYSDYFDAINKQQEISDYESERARLQSQITKLSGASDAASLIKIAELQGKLTTLEEERTKTVEQEAQENIINVLNDEIDRVTDYYDSMLENDDKILAELTEQNYLTVREQYQDMLERQGKTDAQIEQAMTQFDQDFYAGKIYDVDTNEEPSVDSNIPEIAATNNTTNNTINFNGQSYSVSASDQNLLNQLIRQIVSRSTPTMR